MSAHLPFTLSKRRRRYLTLQATVWRQLARIGFWLHKLPRPRPPPPSYVHSFSTSGIRDSAFPPAVLQLAMYVPPDFKAETQQHGRRYPVVVNFHGGGFTMGTFTDDARWAAMLVREVQAVVVSVCYRLAPEHPFPTAVEDGVEAVLYIAAHAEDFGIDASKMALSGFSAGGNLAFTVPLRLQAYLLSRRLEPRELPVLLPQLVSIIAWYPSIDQRLTRAQRKATCPRPDKTLPSILTKLFDESYLPDPSCETSIYASPAAASNDILLTALPDTVAIFLCEWDMLLQEGKEFAERLEGLRKHVCCEVISCKRHAFDKLPNPFRLDPIIALHYKQACDFLSEVFGR